MSEGRDARLQTHAEAEARLSGQRPCAVDDHEVAGERDARDRIVEDLARDVDAREKIVGRDVPAPREANDVEQDSARYTVSFHEKAIL